MRRILPHVSTFFAALLVLLTALTGAPDLRTRSASPPHPSGGTVTAIDRPIRGVLKNARIEIFKSKRLLELYNGKELVRAYHVGLGFDPVTRKTRMGDGATPEGNYYVCRKNPYSRFYLSLGLSYPNEHDAKDGLERKLISRAEYKRIARACKNRTCPPWNTKLGGTIFIHGNGSFFDWTLGCIALDDWNMKELYNAVPLGTPVIIHP